MAHCEQLQDLIRCSEWLPQPKLKIQQKVPLESPLYDLMRDELAIIQNLRRTDTRHLQEGRRYSKCMRPGQKQSLQVYWSYEEGERTMKDKLKTQGMPYHLEPAILEGESAERFIDIVMSTRKGSIDFAEERASAERILDNSKKSIF